MTVKQSLKIGVLGGLGAVEELPQIKTIYSEVTFKTAKVLTRCLLGGDQENLRQKRDEKKWKRMLKG